jgi:hypothetical protein
MSQLKIAGKYLAGLDPSKEMAKVKISSSLGNYRPSFIGAISNPEIQFNQASPEAAFASASPQAAFNAAGLGF